MMRILILNTFMFTAENGVVPKVKSIKDTMMYNMCLGFKQLGHEVTLVAGEEFKPTEVESYDFNVMFVKSNLKKIFPPTILPYSLELKHYLKEHHREYDMVLTSETFMFPSLFAARICPEKTVIWHELALHQRKFHKIPSKLWYNIIARFFMKKVRVVIPRSESAQGFIRRYMETVSVECVEHGIDVDEFECSIEKDNYVVYIGQLIERKNIPSIIRKFASYKQLVQDGLRLLLIGRGEMESELKEIAKEENVEKDLEFIGFLRHSEMTNYLMKAKAMLIDTKQDNNLVSIPEAIVSGTPVLTNLVPTNAPMIRANLLGIAKENWNAEDIKEIIDNNQQYVQNCIEYRANLSVKRQAERIISIFRNYHPRLTFINYSRADNFISHVEQSKEMIAA